MATDSTTGRDDSVFEEPMNEHTSPPNPVLSALVSLIIPGAGQMLNGEMAKGGLILGAYLISMMLIVLLIGFVTTPLIVLYAVIDAYRVAERLEREANL